MAAKASLQARPRRVALGRILRHRALGDEHGRGAVCHLRGVPGRDGERRLRFERLRRRQRGQGLQGGRPADALVVVQELARQVALGVTDGDSDGFLGEMAGVGGLCGAAVAFERVDVHVLARDLELVGQDLGHPELHPQPAVDLFKERRREGAGAPPGVRGQRHARHRFRAAGDGQVVVAGFTLHPLVLIFALSGSLMVSRIRFPKF